MKFPETARGTKCFQTEEQAKSRTCKASERNFVFAKQGQYASFQGMKKREIPAVAAWQFTLYLIPRRNVEATHPHYPDFDVLVEWRELQPPRDLIARLDALLPRNTGWDESTTYWGPEDGTDIQVTHDGDRVSTIYVRLDVRNVDATFVRQVTELAVRCDALFVSSEGDIIVPSQDALAAAISRSDAARFVIDPRSYLAQLPRKPM